MATRKRAAKTGRRRAPRRDSPRVLSLEFVVEADHDANPEDYLFQDPEYRREDQERLDAFNRGDWHMVGVYAKAKVTVAGTVQTVRTPGLWGIESDSDQAYFQETAHDEYENLLDILTELGVSKSRVPPAAQAQWVER